MKQYCRYCCYCIYGDIVWCDDQNKIISKASAKMENHCKNFVSVEGDFFNPLHKYKPIHKRVVDDNRQLNLF